MTGKRIQMAKMLTLVVLPVLGLWGYSVSLLTEVIADKYDNEKVGPPCVSGCRGCGIIVCPCLRKSLPTNMILKR